MFAFLCVSAICFIAVTKLYFWTFFPPRNFPRNIPTVPFYVTLLPLFKDVDQEKIFKEYLEEPLATHGAVKIFFGARWNILLQKPEYMAEIFKDEKTYAKSGNQKKIPYSVLADYTGDNIISAHGDDWRLYQQVLKPGLQKQFDISSFCENALLLIRILKETNNRDGAVLVTPLLQRYTVANLGKAVFSADFQTMEKPDADVHLLQMAVKKEIFKPIFLTFPFLDALPIPSRKKARRTVQVFRDEFCKMVQKSHAGNCCSTESDNLGCRLISARKKSVLREKQFQDNMVISFVAGHENPQLLLSTLIYLLAKHQEIQEKLRREILCSGQDDPSHDMFKNMPYLTSVIYEALRLFPPISQLINRKTTRTVALGNEIIIPKGTYVGYHAYATGRDATCWGLDANEFLPERWGGTMPEIANKYRRAKSKAEFTSFHGGRRACLGEKLAILEARVTLFYLIQRLKWKLDPTWPERMTPAGPLYPRMLRVQVEEL
ncbi:Dit2 protein [Xylona heveae TC161]|uniref:Dit2 protein n=1 Tax=Xylona heveae (strain CBS 132557 / TC161) TaxID=1328760 RepID=A0A165ABW2_XYLHT|nr:Dit2 protein [Xylona heveae TC161]KZF20229.1 Dit2 protein [Xylona heveae TC161]